MVNSLQNKNWIDLPIIRVKTSKRTWDQFDLPNFIFSGWALFFPKKLIGKIKLIQSSFWSFNRYNWKSIQILFWSAFTNLHFSPENLACNCLFFTKIDFLSMFFIYHFKIFKAIYQSVFTAKSSDTCGWYLKNFSCFNLIPVSTEQSLIEYRWNSRKFRLKLSQSVDENHQNRNYFKIKKYLYVK